MAETFYTTNNIEKLTEGVISLSAMSYVLHSTLTESDSFPHDVTGNGIKGLTISNNTNTTISFTITDADTNEVIIRLAGYKNFEATTAVLTSINTSATTSFDIALYTGV